MARELSMVRRLEKIEKELGYCQIKIEREQRLRLQLQFLKMQKSAIEELLPRFAVDKESPKAREADQHGNRLAGIPLADAAHQITRNRQSPVVDRLRRAFRAAGASQVLAEELALITREIESAEERIRSFAVFRAKWAGLTKERDSALSTFTMDHSHVISAMSERFEKTEETWNTLTEDLMNCEQAIYHNNFALDYLRSARTFVLAARSQFSLDSWLREGYLLDLFKHSAAGRAKEMVEGANRNLRSALCELICLDNITIQPLDFEDLLFPFLDALFEDLFLAGRFGVSSRLLEARIARLERLHRELDSLRETLMTQQIDEERQRVRLFNQIGSERRKLPALAKR
ncbi:MAG: hypothetical protein ACKVX7_01275 [Planctomycetota bacterium]